MLATGESGARHHQHLHHPHYHHHHHNREWPAYVNKISRPLTKYAPSLLEVSHGLIIKHFCHLPDFFSHTLNVRTIRSGFDVCGIWPFDAEKMLARCDSWHEWEEAQQDAMIAAIPELSEELAKTIDGKLTDAVILQALPFLAPDPTTKPALAKPKDELHPSRHGHRPGITSETLPQHKQRTHSSVHWSDHGSDLYIILLHCKR